VTNLTKLFEFERPHHRFRSQNQRGSSGNGRIMSRPFSTNRHQSDQREKADNPSGHRIIGDLHHDNRADDHDEPDRHHPIAATAAVHY
jgi:hypothetical protein